VQRQPDFRAFADRAAASSATAGILEESLRRDLQRRGRAALVVSGGSSPAAAFRQLSAAPVDWRQVAVTLSDERWVPAEDPASNAGMLRRDLLRGPAAAARLVPLFRPGMPASQAAPLVEQDLLALPRPFSCVLLGMGEDGHFASLFPDFDGLAEALDPEGRVQCVAVSTAASPFPRVSLTLAALLDTALVLLLIFGSAKQGVYEAALGGAAYPVTALLQQGAVPVTVVWAP